MGSRLLYFAGDRLSHAELTAACLDGDIVEVGEGYAPADTVETVALRAASLRPLLGDDLAATHLSAAWIHGGLVHPPGRHTVQRTSPRRRHTLVSRRLQYRDIRVDPDDLLRCGGTLVTSRARTLADLLREESPVYADAARAFAIAVPAVLEETRAWLESSTLPHVRRARAALTALGDQLDVTR
ncbi:type IV toxin-antitoxin system AbiEi family antitoxin [Microbacterium aurantiacum]|uniref:type IV toxin-antitoxin system AbiEi family antitoxin n=1 Tax=Microbacterium aurantiacum TaxID=162393 RepID=UPI001F3D0D16|nr:type IV toxin-antitoxin system AbiEi family antitoxin [Microbacterium aurantiacum]